MKYLNLSIALFFVTILTSSCQLYTKAPVEPAKPLTDYDQLMSLLSLLENVDLTNQKSIQSASTTQEPIITQPSPILSPDMHKELLIALPDPFKAASLITTMVGLTPISGSRDVASATTTLSTLPKQTSDILMQKLQLATYSLDAIYDALGVLSIAAHMPLSLFSNTTDIVSNILAAPATLGLLGFGSLQSMAQMVLGAALPQQTQNVRQTAATTSLALADLTKTTDLQQILEFTDTLATYLDSFLITLSQGRNTVLGRIVTDIQTILLQVAEDPTNVSVWNALVKQLELLQTNLQRMKRSWTFESAGSLQMVDKIITDADEITTTIATASVFDDASDILSSLFQNVTDLLSNLFSLNNTLLTPILSSDSLLLSTLTNLTTDLINITMSDPIIGNISSFFDNTINQVASLVGNITQISTLEDLNPIKLLTNLPLIGLQFLDLSYLISVVTNTTALIPEILLDATTTTGNVISSLLSLSSLNSLTEALGAVTSAFSGFISGIITSGFGGVFNAFLDPFNALLSNAIGSALSGAGTGISTSLTDTLNSAVDSLVAASTTLTDTASSVTSAASTAISGVEGTVNSLVTSAISSISTTAGTAVSNIESTLTSLIESLLSGTSITGGILGGSSAALAPKPLPATNTALNNILSRRLLQAPTETAQESQIKRVLQELEKRASVSQRRSLAEEQAQTQQAGSLAESRAAQAKLINQLQQEIQKYHHTRNAECDKINQQLKHILVAKSYDPSVKEAKALAVKLCTPATFVDLTLYAHQLSELAEKYSSASQANSDQILYAQTAYSKFFSILKKEQALAQQRYEVYEKLKAVTPSIRSVA